MRLIKILLGEFILLFASVLIFRSVWTLLDQNLGYNNLFFLLIIGVILTVVGLYVVNHEVKCVLQKKDN
jgi:Na+/melibiose symporter-like transporter